MITAPVNGYATPEAVTGTRTGAMSSTAGRIRPAADAASAIPFVGVGWASIERGIRVRPVRLPQVVQALTDESVMRHRAPGLPSHRP
jgi:hypothetical protein